MREDTGPRPSARAAERLAADVGAEVADLRGSLRRALDEADRLQAVGRTDLAAEVLEDQRETLAAVHRHLAERLAEAAVEREADHIVEVAAQPAAAAAASPSPTWDGTVVRLVASAAAAIAGLTLLFTPDLGSGVLEAAGFGDTEEAVPAEPGATGPAAPEADETAGAASQAPEPTAADAVVQSAVPTVELRLGGGGAAEPTTPAAPGPRPAPSSLTDVVERAAVELVGPVLGDERTEEAEGDRAADEADGGDTSMPSSDGTWQDVDLDGSSAE